MTQRSLRQGINIKKPKSNLLINNFSLIETSFYVNHQYKWGQHNQTATSYTKANVILLYIATLLLYSNNASAPTKNSISRLNCFDIQNYLRYRSSDNS